MTSQIKQSCKNHISYQGDFYTLDNPLGCQDCRTAEKQTKELHSAKSNAEWLIVNKQAIKAPNRQVQIGDKTVYWSFMEHPHIDWTRRAIWNGQIVGTVDLNTLYCKIGISFCFGRFRVFDNSHWRYEFGYRNVDVAEKVTEQYLSENPWIFDRLQKSQ